jgi:hypothetical protein
MSESRQRSNQRRLAGVLGFTEARGLARHHLRQVLKPAEQFPADCRRIAVRGGQVEGDQLLAVGGSRLMRAERTPGVPQVCDGAAALASPSAKSLIIPTKSSIPDELKRALARRPVRHIRIWSQISN